MTGRVTDRLWGALPSLPRLGREVEIPVYVIHNSRDAEDYFFIFDFEAFVERSREGVFVRPVLKILAGRDDFSRPVFARQVREAFTREFDAARAALRAQSQSGLGWFTWDLAAFSLTGFVSTLILLVATTTGKAVWAMLPERPDWMRGKSDEVKLEDRIAETQAAVDRALAASKVHLHRELYTWAWRGGAPGPLTGIDYDAWPLPETVRAHLADGRTQAWY